MCFLQAARQGILLMGDGNQMDVIAHQAIPYQFHTVSLDALLQQIVRFRGGFVDIHDR